MKLMKKLSSKLLLALGGIILGIIVWQVIVSKQVIGDMEKIGRSRSIEQMHDLLNEGELKTYQAVPCSPFSKIKLCGVNAYILKGNEYEVYISDYCKKYVEVAITGDELVFNLKRKIPARSDNAMVFIFMPKDPQFVHCIKADDSPFANRCVIQGFKGDNTLLFCEGERWMSITTDMSYINVNQKDSYLYICTSGLDSTLRIEHVQLNVRGEKGSMSLDDRISDSINVDIQFRESDIRNLKINSASKVGTLSLKGSLSPDISNYSRTAKMKINYPGTCDSLLIQLTNNSEKTKQLWLSKDLSGRFENIDCSENVLINRVE